MCKIEFWLKEYQQLKTYVSATAVKTDIFVNLICIFMVLAIK